MENIGISRRVDELGRVVVPKEMRNLLRIKPGDCLEAYLDNEKIILVKQELISKSFDVISPILESYSKILDVDILITSMDKIVKSNGKNLKELENKKINNYIYQCIVGRKKELQNNKTLFLENINYIINPIVINGDAIGSIIYIKQKDKITEFDELNVKVIENLFHNSLEVY